MSDLAYLTNAARELQALNKDLQIDQATEAYARAATLEAWANQLTEDELRVVLGPSYSNQARFWLEARLTSHTINARKELEKAMGNGPSPEEIAAQNELGRQAMLRDTAEWSAKNDGWTGD